jgi:hypothetical protein
MSNSINRSLRRLLKRRLQCLFKCSIQLDPTPSLLAQANHYLVFINEFPSILLNGPPIRFLGLVSSIPMSLTLPRPCSEQGLVTNLFYNFFLD